MSDTVAVLEKYKNMVRVSDHHVLLKEKSMVQFLAYVLDSPNKVEVSLALEVVELMAENPQNHQQLRSAGVLETLDKMAQSGDGNNNAQQATRVLTLMRKPSIPLVLRHSAPAHMFPSVVYVLNIPGLTNVLRRDVEYGVICNRGVISVVVDVRQERCTVRSLSKVTPTDLANSIHNKTGLAVRLVTKNKKGQEVYEDLVKSPDEKTDDIKSEEVDKSLNDTNMSDVADDGDLPEYLPEEEPPVKASAITSFARFKTGAASLARSASSFFSESFYW